MTWALFLVFVLILFGIAVFHKRSFEIAFGGLTILIILKFAGGDFSLADHLLHGGEWKILLNLFGLLTGFEILSWHFQNSGIPQRLPAFFPDDWKGGFVLLCCVFVMSAFLDNIAAAMIGGAIASFVYNGKVHIAFVAAIVASANAGGAGSVLGDTTTTMLWISGVSPVDVIGAYLGATIAFLIPAFYASRVQQKFQQILKDENESGKIDKLRILIVLLMLVATAIANVAFDFPAIGLWFVIVVSLFITNVSWKPVKHSMRGTLFLLALVIGASLLPVHELPAASPASTLGLGFLSSVFDNIPLTKLAIEQGGYDWGLLAFAVGFGGSMTWFGSSAGVAICNRFPEARSVFRWIRSGWPVAAGYLIGYFVQLAVLGWKP